MSKSPFDLFDTDPVLETQGIIVDYGDYWFRVSRIDAPGSAFVTMLKERMQPYERALQLGEMDEKRALQITCEVYARTAVLDWGYRKDLPEGAPATAEREEVKGKMIGRGGVELDFTPDNVHDVLKALPAQFQDLMNQSRNIALFRRIRADEAAGN